jgi:uncharacterized protein YcbX
MAPGGADDTAEATAPVSDNPAIHVRALLITPIKGLRVTPREELMLERAGVRDNRRFYLVDERGRMVNGKQIGELTELRSEYRDADRSLTLTLPDGERISGAVCLGEEIDTRFFRRTLRASVVLGPWSDAISTHVGRPLRLVEADPAQKESIAASGAPCRSYRGAHSSGWPAVAGNGGEIDARRFRMLVEIDGIDPHGEDAWVGRRVRIGEALVGFNGHVGRCLVTSRDPDSGVVDLPTLDLIRRVPPRRADDRAARVRDLRRGDRARHRPLG